MSVRTARGKEMRKCLSGRIGVTLLAVLVGLLSVLLLSACTRGEIEVKNTVSAYTQMLPEALLKPDAEKMRFFASSDEIMRIDAYILQMRQERKLMQSFLKTLEFRSVDIAKGKQEATVTTNEVWRYRYLDEKSRQPVSDESMIAYNNMYYLIKDQGHWVVNRIDLNETALPPAAVSPGAGKPHDTRPAGGGKKF